MESGPEAGETGHELLRAEALLTFTLALMTAHAQSRTDDERQLIGAKIHAHLSQLASHSTLSPHFRMALWTLMGHWDVLQDPHSSFPAEQDRHLWHTVPSSVH